MMMSLKKNIELSENYNQLKNKTKLSTLFNSKKQTSLQKVINGNLKWVQRFTKRTYVYFVDGVMFLDVYNN